MANKSKGIENLVKGGLVGALIGTVLAKDKEEGAVIGAILGAVFAATIEAHEKAIQTQVPFYVVENGEILEVRSDGTKKFVRKIEKPDMKFPDNFELK